MKKIFILLIFTMTAVFAQNDSVKVYKSGLYFGFSGLYPHYMTITQKSVATHKNFGLGAHVGYDLTEHFGFRLSGNYILLSSFWYGDNREENDNYLNMATANIDAIYNILPCELVSPYMIIGYGFTWFKSSNPYLGPEGTRTWIKNAFTGNQFEFGLGAEFKFWNDIHLKAEANYITATNNKIDGNEAFNDTKGLLFSNGDTYMNLKFGVSWYFWRSKKSKICEPFSIKEVIREVPVEKLVIDTVYVDKVVEKAITKRESFVLENVRFKFDSDELTPLAKVTLDNVANTLNKYPDQKIEILGHTDNIGTDEYNLDLSKRRAISVKNYLVSQGVEGNRLFTGGCGERKPVADNSTEVGRSINRRIEFSLYKGQLSECSKANVGENSNFEEAVKNSEQVKIEGIFFKFDSDELVPESETTLRHVADVLKKYPKAKVEIQGHTDSLGKALYNEFLSKRRAESVKKFLVSQGIDASRLNTIGYGETKPIEDNGTAYGRAVNRRIEFKISNSDNLKIQSAKPAKDEALLDPYTTPEERQMAESIKKGKKLVFSNIHFEVNSDLITKESTKILNEAVNVLSQMPDVDIEIQGYTDSDGSKEYNQQLSENRAIAVKNYLVKKGISVERLTAIGYGESNPIADNSTKEGKEKNRRIEFKIIK